MASVGTGFDLSIIGKTVKRELKKGGEYEKNYFLGNVDWISGHLFLREGYRPDCPRGEAN
jgi:hypothetical protein